MDNEIWRELEDAYEEEWNDVDQWDEEEERYDDSPLYTGPRFEGRPACSGWLLIFLVAAYIFLFASMGPCHYPPPDPYDLPDEWAEPWELWFI